MALEYDVRASAVQNKSKLSEPTLISALADSYYGSHYTIASVLAPPADVTPRARRLEALVDRTVAPELVQGYWKPLVPSVTGDDSYRKIWLPSREPLGPPGWLWTGGLIMNVGGSSVGSADDQTRDDWPAAWWTVAWPSTTRQKRLDRSALKRGVLLADNDAASAQPPLLATGLSGAAPPDKARQDWVQIGAAFTVWSDEEGGFSTDEFYLELTSDDGVGLASSTAEPPWTDKARHLFTLLGNALRLEELADVASTMLDAAAADDVVRCVSYVLSGSGEPAPKEPPATWARLEIVEPEEDDTERAPLIAIDTGGTEGWHLASAALFLDPGTGGVQTAKQGLLVVVACVPVWRAVSLSLYHARNTRDRNEDAPAFAPVFGQVQPPVGGDVFWAPARVADLSGEAEKLLNDREWTTDGLVALLQSTFIGETRDTHVQITTHHRQRRNKLIDWVGTRGKAVDKVGRFGLRRVSTASEGTVEVFPAPYRQFDLDFIWYRDGVEIFRIVRFPVRIQ